MASKAVKKPEPIKTKRRTLNEMQNVNGDPVVQLATRVPKGTYRELKLYAVTTAQSISQLVGEAIGDLLTKKGWKMKKAS